MEPAKRDSHPEDVSKGIEEKLGQMFPGMEVRWAGDEKPGELPPEVNAKMEAFLRREEELSKLSLSQGICHDCGKKMPGVYPPPDNDDDWEPAKGWSWYSDSNNDDMPLFWVCPECDAEGDGIKPLPI